MGKKKKKKKPVTIESLQKKIEKQKKRIAELTGGLQEFLGLNKSNEVAVGNMKKEVMALKAKLLAAGGDPGKMSEEVAEIINAQLAKEQAANELKDQIRDQYAQMSEVEADESRTEKSRRRSMDRHKHNAKQLTDKLLEVLDHLSPAWDAQHALMDGQETDWRPSEYRPSAELVQLMEQLGDLSPEPSEDALAAQQLESGGIMGDTTKCQEALQELEERNQQLEEELVEMQKMNANDDKILDEMEKAVEKNEKLKAALDKMKDKYADLEKQNEAFGNKLDGECDSAASRVADLERALQNNEDALRRVTGSKAKDSQNGDRGDRDDNHDEDRDGVIGVDGDNRDSSGLSANQMGQYNADEMRVDDEEVILTGEHLRDLLAALRANEEAVYDLSVQHHECLQKLKQSAPVKAKKSRSGSPLKSRSSSRRSSRKRSSKTSSKSPRRESHKSSGTAKSSRRSSQRSERTARQRASRAESEKLESQKSAAPAARSGSESVRSGSRSARSSAAGSEPSKSKRESRRSSSQRRKSDESKHPEND